MGNFADGKVYDKLGIRPMINAMGAATVLGGSTPSDMIKQAMEEASHGYVEMADLTAKAGDYIAGLLGTEAAYPHLRLRRRHDAQLRRRHDRQRRREAGAACRTRPA